MFISNKVLNAPRVESSKDPGSHRVDRSDYDARSQRDPRKKDLSIVGTFHLLRAAGIVCTGTRGASNIRENRWRSARSDFSSEFLAISRLGRKKASRKVEKVRTDTRSSARWQQPITIDPIRRRATSRTKRKVPRKRRAGGKATERKKKEVKTYVMRSDLTHAAHAGGTTICDRICRHRLRVVLVGNGNLEGKCTDDEGYLRAHPG